MLHHVCSVTVTATVTVTVRTCFHTHVRTCMQDRVSGMRLIDGERNVGSGLRVLKAFAQPGPVGGRSSLVRETSLLTARSDHCDKG